MAHIILVHGAWHGGWCWERVVPALEALGHTVEAPDLPGMGDDDTPFAPDTFAQWRDAIVTRVAAAPGKVVLVGHSRGGIVISAVAEVVPDRIARLVYVTAFLLNGQSLSESVAAAAENATDGHAGPPLVIDEAAGTCTVPEEARRRVFYNKCSESDVAAASARLCPEPLQPLATPVAITAENYGRVPRSYIGAEHDCAITPDWQRRMQADLPCDPVITLDCDHSPFYSATDELVAVLDRLALA